MHVALLRALRANLAKTNDKWTICAMIGDRVIAVGDTAASIYGPKMRVKRGGKEVMVDLVSHNSNAVTFLSGQRFTVRESGAATTFVVTRAEVTDTSCA